MNERADDDQPGRRLLALYDEALPRVYGYLFDRCRNRAVAEDLTSETFLAAVRAGQIDPPPVVSTPWLVGVARHKLADHWRRQTREERAAEAVGVSVDVDDPWDAHIDHARAIEVLDAVGPHHRVALTLRYVDGCSVPEVAEILGRTVHATEALLVRARKSFRRQYEKGETDAV
jgi:RNA polymerase sigma-70 factor (ECF subfamily)